MKKRQIIPFALAVIVIVITGVYLVYAHHQQRSRAREPLPVAMMQGQPAPLRMTALGPVGTGIDSTEYLGDIQIHMTADRLWFKKTKTFGFDNGLMKKLAARNFQLSIYRAGRKLISLRKQDLEMSLDQDKITISRPEVVFPPDFGRTDAIQLEKKNKLLHIRTGQSTTTWELSRM